MLLLSEGMTGINSSAMIKKLYCSNQTVRFTISFSDIVYDSGTLPVPRALDTKASATELRHFLSPQII